MIEFVANSIFYREGDSPRGSCYGQQGTDDFDPLWEWVKYAKYNGTEEYNHHKIDIYVYKVSQ